MTVTTTELLEHSPNEVAEELVTELTELLEHSPKKVAKKLVQNARRASRVEWLSEFTRSLDHYRPRDDFSRFLAVWGLNQSAAADLLGVSRQAVAKWKMVGVPQARVEAISDLSAATDLLVRYLKPDRIPAVVRRHSSRLDGQSLLDLVQADRSREVLVACRAMFDFGNVHA